MAFPYPVDDVDEEKNISDQWSDAGVLHLKLSLYNTQSIYGTFGLCHFIHQTVSFKSGSY